jgi:hypothetical protein
MQSFSFHDELSVNIQSVYKGLVFFPWVMHQFGKLTNLVEDLVCFSYSLGEDSNMSIMVKASSSGDMSIMVKASSSGELPGRSAGWIKDFASARNFFGVLRTPAITNSFAGSPPSD